MKGNRVKRLSNLKATTAAAGVTMALAQSAPGADLDTNLVVNGDFESVDPGISTAYGNAQVDGGWVTATGADVFAYNYAQNYDDRNDLGEVPPGNDPTSSTDYFFTMNGNTNEGAIQNIDLSSGASASLIASGAAGFDLQAYYTNYAEDLEVGRLTLEFYDGDPGVFGDQASLIGDPVEFIDPDTNEWSLIGGTGEIPSNAQWARIRLDQDPKSGASGGPDVYVDNVSFQVTSGGSGGPIVVEIAPTEAGGFELIWESLPDVVYGVESSTDLENWTEVTDDVPSEGTETRFDLTAAGVTGDRVYLRVFEVN